LPHHNPDFSAAYRRGMASDAREDVNLDDGRDCSDRPVADSSPIRSTAGQILEDKVFRYLALLNTPILSF
jgi:hypothetical protein